MRCKFADAPIQKAKQYNDNQRDGSCVVNPHFVSYAKLFAGYNPVGGEFYMRVTDGSGDSISLECVSDGKIIDEVYGRAERCAVIFRVIISIHRIFVLLVKAVTDFFLAVITLNGTATGNHFFGITVEFTELAGTLLEERANLFGTVTGKDNGNGNRDYEYENHRFGDLPHEDQ